MKSALIVLSVVTLFLGYQMVKLQGQVDQLQQNTAIAVLSAEAANNKIGAIAPYFKQDKAAFAKAWMDSQNLPLAVFPEEVLVPIKQRLERLRTSPENVKLRDELFR
jgi:hypothetical protein